MTAHGAPNPGETDRLLQRAAAGDHQALSLLFAEYRERLRRLVALRLDPHLHKRLDASDVIQETYLEAWSRLAEYLRQPKTSFYLWLRFLARQKLVTLRRHHQAGNRDVEREGPSLGASSRALADQLLGHDSRPSAAARRAELQARIQEALDRMEPLDREVLVLRHYEQLGNAEVAQELGLQESAASKRYRRALERIMEVLGGLPGGLGEVVP
jgi:RNA polymerase sigma-70 factor (ECF subfamily)